MTQLLYLGLGDRVRSNMETRRVAKQIPRRSPPAQRRGRIPAKKTNLSESERKLLPDSNWVREDDADAIIARRRLREKPIPLEQALKRYGSRRVAS